MRGKDLARGLLHLSECGQKEVVFVLEVHYRPQKNGVKRVQLKVWLQGVRHCHKVHLAVFDKTARPVLKRFVIGIEYLKKNIRNQTKLIQDRLGNRLVLAYPFFPESAHELHML